MPDKAKELEAVWQKQTDAFTALAKKTAPAPPPAGGNPKAKAKEQPQ